MSLRARAVGRLLSCILGLVAAEAMAHGNAAGNGAAPVAKEQKAWGIAGEGRSGLRTIRVSMNDRMKFVPDRIVVREGETVRLLIQNTGKSMHEFVMGTRRVLDEHAALMKRFPGMEHDEPYMAHVAPGRTGAIVWTFNRAGEFDFGCLIAGHYESGMVGRIRVETR